MALDWLLSVIRTEQPEVLLITGDIFDVNNPPVSAERMYYHFLNELKTTTTCRHVVIIGGNHDSPSKLNAPRELLRAFNIHVTGAATENPEEALILLEDPQGQPEMLLAAIPFLRERDVAQAVPGESVAERINRIRAGIVQYYERVGTAAAEKLGALPHPVPVVATGHLVATGASASEEQRNIYLGNLDNISAEQIPAVFDYVALGHIHRPQRIAQQERIRYSGSLLPLSFSEIKDKKNVLVVDFQKNGQLDTVRAITAPVFRRLLALRGTFEELTEKIPEMAQPDDRLPAWLKISVAAKDLPNDVNDRLRELAKANSMEILRLEIDRKNAPLADTESVVESLKLLATEAVFLRRCESEGRSEAATAQLLQTFRELIGTL